MAVCSPRMDLQCSSLSLQRPAQSSLPLSRAISRVCGQSTQSMDGLLMPSTVPSSNAFSPLLNAATERSPVEPAALSPTRFSRTSSHSSPMITTAGCSQPRSRLPGRPSCIVGSSRSPTGPSLTPLSTSPRPACPALLTNPCSVTSRQARQISTRPLPRSLLSLSPLPVFPSRAPTLCALSTTASNGPDTTLPSSPGTASAAVLLLPLQRQVTPRSRSSSWVAGSRTRGSCTSTSPSPSSVLCPLGSIGSRQSPPLAPFPLPLLPHSPSGCLPALLPLPPLFASPPPHLYANASPKHLEPRRPMASDLLCHHLCPSLQRPSCCAPPPVRTLPAHIPLLVRSLLVPMSRARLLPHLLSPPLPRAPIPVPLIPPAANALSR
ncbi:hypothetical protein B0H10DRAFT_1893240 [Mycena sp. CBHHK59/15]|nr:hypothetical protein B0H10DRAFT_1893240 [Mycena sp. CBHHK59/15]